MSAQLADVLTGPLAACLADENAWDAVAVVSELLASNCTPAHGRSHAASSAAVHSHSGSGRGDERLEQSAAETAGADVARVMHTVDARLDALVSEHEDALLAGADIAHNASASLASALALSSKLQADVASLVRETVTPFEALRADVAALEKVMHTSAALRATQRVLQLTRKARDAMRAVCGSETPTEQALASALADSHQLMRITPLLRDALAACEQPEVAGIDAVTTAAAWLSTITSALQRHVQMLVLQSTASLHAAELSLTLSAAHDVGALGSVTTAVLRHYIDSVAAAVRDAMDVRALASAAAATAAATSSGAPAPAPPTSVHAPGAVAFAAAAAAGAAYTLNSAAFSPPTGGAALWRSVLWTRVESVASALAAAVTQFWSFVYVLAEAREGGATGRALLLDAAPNVTALHQVASAEHDRAGSACDSVLPRAADAPPPVALLSALWAALCAVWSDELAAVMATAQYAFMRTNLVDVYPRLHYALLSVHSTTEKSVALRSATGMGIDLFQAACQPRGLVWAAAPLLRAFLSKSVARLNESVARCFPHPPGSGGSAVTRAAVRGAMGSSATSLASSSEQANGFHVSHDFARALDVLPHDEAPSTAAIAAVLRSVAQEFSMCRPSGVYAGEQVDVALMGAVSRVVTSTLRQLVSRMEAAALTSSPAATVLVDHCMPTPVQRHHLALACRLDEVRAACVRLLSELPLPAALGGSESTSAAPDGGTHSLDAFSAATLAGANSVSAVAGLASTAAVCAAATSARRRVHPLALPVPTSLSLLAYYAAATQEGATSDAACGMLRACGASDAEVDTVSAVVGATAHGQLLLAIASVEQLLHGLILPWAARLMLPLERTTARMHEASYAAAVGDAPQMTSAYVTEAHAIVSRFNEHQLSLLSPGALNDAVRTLLCGRLLNCICFHLCLVRGLVSAPASRFHTDSAALEGVLAQLLPTPSKLGKPFAQYRALRIALQLSSADIARALAPASSEPTTTAEALPAAPESSGDGAAPNAASSTARQAKILSVLRTLTSHNLFHLLLSRLPEEAPLPHVCERQSVLAYAAQLDDVAIAADAKALAPLTTYAPPCPLARMFISRTGTAAADGFALARVQECLRQFTARLALRVSDSGEGSVPQPDSFPEFLVLRDYGAQLLRAT